METLQKQTLYVCGCCRNTLPSEAFYVDKKTGLPKQLLQGMPQIRQPEIQEDREAHAGT